MRHHSGSPVGGRAGPPGQDLVRLPAFTLVLVSDVKQEMSQGKHASFKRSWVARGQNETSLNLKQISINYFTFNKNVIVETGLRHIIVFTVL